MIILTTIIFFIFGLIIGSFLNVVVYRYNTEKTLGGRSACMSCESRLSWYDLIPLFSFLILQGRCRSCQTKISKQYFFVELLTGIVFAGLFYKFQGLFFYDTLSFTLNYAYYAVMFALLVVIAVYDLKHKIIPDMLALFFGVLAFVGMFFFGGAGVIDTEVMFRMPSMLNLFSGVLLALPFASIWFLSKGKLMGLGDAKLIMGLGYLLGFYQGLSAIFISFWLGAIVGIILLLLAKKGMKSEIPFAPFLVLGTYLTFIFNISVFLMTI